MYPLGPTAAATGARPFRGSCSFLVILGSTKTDPTLPAVEGRASRDRAGIIGGTYSEILTCRASVAMF